MSKSSAPLWTRLFVKKTERDKVNIQVNKNRKRYNDEKNTEHAKSFHKV